MGSAAFNLLAISAVCISGIPEGETRRIKQFPVFCITALFSILAYIWLVLVLVVISKDLIEIWEAVLTFLFFPLLVTIAYSADKGWLNVLFCQDQAKLNTKQQQIELGTLHKGDAMLSDKEYFRGGKLDRNALSGFIAGSICTSFICLCIYVVLSLSISIIMNTYEIIKNPTPGSGPGCFWDTPYWPAHAKAKRL